MVIFCYWTIRGRQTEHDYMPVNPCFMFFLLTMDACFI